MKKDKMRIHPVEKAGGLMSGFRKLVQNPAKILKGYVKEGMTVLDWGCGPGYFSIPMARMAGPDGKVIAADVQEGMLEVLRKNKEYEEVKSRLILHKCEASAIGLEREFDLILVFYVFHEMPDPKGFFREVMAHLKRDGILILVEPKFHMSGESFKSRVEQGKNSGLMLLESPKIFMSRTAVFKNQGRLRAVT